MSASRTICNRSVKLAAMAALALVGPGAWPRGSDAGSPGRAEILPARGEIQAVKVIDDKGTHTHWILITGSAAQGGPGRLVQRGGMEVGMASGTGLASAPTGVEEPTVRPIVIHAGDVLIVEEHSLATDTQIEAVAMEPARLGALLRVRTKFGTVVRASAIGEKRARLSSSFGEKP